jgi:drug/metabolite transporter (DMT)-like permease
MSTAALLAVLGGALLHAVWNAMVKAARDKGGDLVLVMSGAALVSLPFLPFLPLPAAASHPFLAASVVIHCAYFYFVATAYRLGDFGHVYPLMRGAAPLLVALASGVVLDEGASVGVWLGVLVISGSIIGLMCARSGAGRPSTGATAAALANAVVIALYTGVDGVGVRLSGNAAAYTLWLFVSMAIPLLVFALWRSPAGVVASFRGRWWTVVVGGFCTVGSYALALWAMTMAPITVIAALRETSILFAMLIGALFLGEWPTRLRLVCGAGIAFGVILLRLTG